MTLALARVKETGLPLVYLNQIGGQDELCSTARVCARCGQNMHRTDESMGGGFKYVSFDKGKIAKQGWPGSAPHEEGTDPPATNPSITPGNLLVH